MPHLGGTFSHRYIWYILTPLLTNVNDTESELHVTPLYFAVNAGEVDCVKMLLNRGASVNAGRVMSILHIAVANQEHDNSHIIEMLLQKGANPNSIDLDGARPINYASGKYGLEYIRLLIKYGADVNAKDMHGKTVLYRINHHVGMNGYMNMPKQSRELLIRNGARE